MPTLADLTWDNPLENPKDLFFKHNVMTWKRSNAGHDETIAEILFQIPESKWIHREATGSMGDPARFDLLDRATVDEYIGGEIIVEAAIMPAILRTRLGIDCHSTPPEMRSSINVRRYSGEDCEGRHYDTQPYAALVFYGEGAPLQLLIDDEWVDIPSEFGRRVIFKGSEIIHRVPPGKPGQVRMSLCYNLYTNGNYNRPEFIDKMLYENMSYEDATS